MNVSVATNPPASIAGNRRSAQRAATRARLFDETVKEFKARGFAETEIEVITERVGVSRGAFYVHRG
ncbi:MAG: TetR/AcrR family transcriptional regulator [Actinobacteria bacterium]|nr:TetR/AcrR family transcriptional regulator [Actinomycetota bacterium]